MRSVVPVACAQFKHWNVKLQHSAAHSLMHHWQSVLTDSSASFILDNAILPRVIAAAEVMLTRCQPSSSSIDDTIAGVGPSNTPSASRRVAVAHIASVGVTCRCSPADCAAQACCGIASSGCLFARHTSHVIHHTSHVTRHTSHVTRHTSHVTRHTSPSHRWAPSDTSAVTVVKPWIRVFEPLHARCDHLTAASTSHFIDACFQSPSRKLHSNKIGRCCWSDAHKHRCARHSACNVAAQVAR
jgi:hypothetical protein